MLVKQYLDNYPTLKELFYCHADSFEKNNPIVSLVSHGNSQISDVAMRTDKCCELVKKSNQDWLNKKVKKMLEDRDITSISAALGEIRAYGELIWVWGNDVNAGDVGNDFYLGKGEDELKIRIEVNTPQHKTKRNYIEHESININRVKITECEIFPFGWPERNIDNIQGEATSKLASIKQSEYQFKPDSINILWVDLKDPALWKLDFGSEQFIPLSIFRDEITSGAFWNAFYAKKGCHIYDALNINGLPSTIYTIEYDGRFWNKSLIDFVVADTTKHKIVFQNPNREMSIANQLFQKIHGLFAFNLELSWLDWPTKGKLKERVELELERIQSYKDAFMV